MTRRRLLRGLGPAILLAMGGAYALASGNWCGVWEPSPPALVGVGIAHGPLHAGAASRDIELPYPVTVAGYAPPRPEVPSASTPIRARAVILEVAPVRVGIVSLDLLTAPATLAEQIRTKVAPLGFSDLWVVATHAHSSVGGYDPRLVSELAGTSAYRPEVEARLVDAAVAALWAASDDVGPAQWSVQRADASGLVRARSGGDVDPGLMRIALARDASAAGSTFAELWLLAAHPTLVSREPGALSADYPGLLDPPDDGRVVLVLQTAVGNASAQVPPGDGPAEARFARALTAAFDQALVQPAPPETTLGFSRVTVGMPRPDASRLVPWFARAAGDNLLCRSADRTTSLSALRLGEHVWLSAPGEPSHAAARMLEDRTGATDVIALANGYVGYVEPAEVVRRGDGESKRQYFGPSLLESWAAAGRVAVQAVMPPRPPGQPAAQTP